MHPAKESMPSAPRQRAAPRAAARLVRPASPPAAVAGAGGRARRSVPGLAVGNHAAADRREDGRAVFREVPGALAGCRGAGPRLARRCAADVGGARLLLARAQSACLRGGGAARSWRRFPGHRRRPARAAGDRALHGGGDRGDRVRPPHHAGRRQYRARGVAAVRGRGAAAAGEAADPATGGDAASRDSRRRREVSRRRQRAGADGSGLLDLHAEEAGLRAVSARTTTARRARAATRRRFRARRRRRRARCGAARPSSSRAATSCWCARGPKRACSAA